MLSIDTLLSRYLKVYLKRNKKYLSHLLSRKIIQVLGLLLLGFISNH